MASEKMPEMVLAVQHTSWPPESTGTASCRSGIQEGWWEPGIPAQGAAPCGDVPPHSAGSSGRAVLGATRWEGVSVSAPLAIPSYRPLGGSEQGGEMKFTLTQSDN